jgi:hypothetical protein
VTDASAHAVAWTLASVTPSCCLACILIYFVTAYYPTKGGICSDLFFVLRVLSSSRLARLAQLRHAGFLATALAAKYRVKH